MRTKLFITIGNVVTALLVGPTASGQVTPPAETELAKLLASDGGPSDKFGFSLDAEGDTLLIGSPHHYSPPDGLGSVYVFGRAAGGTWQEQDRLFPSDPRLGTEFGHDVALDGDTFVAGAPFEMDEEGAFMGAAYVFVRDAAGTWSESQKLVAPGITGGDLFGKSVALDGDFAVFSGGMDAYVYTRDAQGAWSFQTVLQGISTHAIALHAQTILLAGSFAEGDFGAVVYVQGPAGWVPQAELHLPPADENDFGVVSVAIEGDTAVLGVRTLFGTLNGAFVFVRSAGVWTGQAAPLPEDVAGDNFGSAVDIAGNRFIVGATHNAFTGAAWVYSRNPTGNWTPLVKLVPSDFPLSFGFAVKLDGPTPFVGAWADADAAPYAGSAYVFDDVATQCPADLDGDGSVGIQDFLALLGSWGTPGGDIDGDGVTGIQDLLALLAAWSGCA
jgi:hypothetical protein